MTTHQHLSAKAVNSGDQSDAIVVSFRKEWHAHILASDFSLVLRKRIPSESTQFKWVYMHVNSPVGAICARAEITAIERLSTCEAIARQKEINLTERAIRDYIASSDTIGTYRIRNIEVAQTSLSTAVVNEHLVYFPPQSFLILSQHGKKVLDGLAGFPRPTSRHSKRRPV